MIQSILIGNYEQFIRERIERNELNRMQKAETGTGDPQHCYEYWLDRRLKGQYEIINKGYGSDTTDRMLARFDRDVLANSPQYCIIQGGTNDMYMSL